MPHDKNNEQLHIGDTVIVRCIVAQIQEKKNEFCNVQLETIEPMYPDNFKSTMYLNAKQVELSQVFTFWVDGILCSTNKQELSGWEIMAIGGADAQYTLIDGDAHYSYQNKYLNQSDKFKVAGRRFYTIPPCTY
jgi:hypothetical protein